MRIVNGYVCMTGCDVRVAKQGVDPENPRRDPVKQQMLDAERALRTGRPDPEKAKVETAGAVSAGTANARLVDRLA